MPLIRRSSDTAADSAGSPATSDLADVGRRLESHDADARLSAVRDATRGGEAEILVRHVGRETNRGIRETIFTSLIRMGGTKSARPLAAMLRNCEDAQLRNTVIETMQAMGVSALPEIERLLEDDDPDVRIYAMNTLQFMQSADVPEIALRIIARDPHINVCAAAVDVLAEFGRPEMADALRAVAERFPGQPFLDFAVRAAIKRIG